MMSTEIKKTALGKNFAFYGTLRRNQGNHRWSVAKDSGAEFDGEHVIGGYKMYSLGGYPFVTPSNNVEDSVVVELFKLTEEDIINSIHRMEIGAGYTTVDIEVNGHVYTMYVQSGRNAGYYPEVPAGDWVKYIEEKRKAYLDAKER